MIKELKEKKFSGWLCQVVRTHLPEGSAGEGKSGEVSVRVWIGDGSAIILP